MLERFCCSERTALVHAVMAVTTSLDSADVDIEPNGIAGSQNDNYFVFARLILSAAPCTAAHSGNTQLCV